MIADSELASTVGGVSLEMLMTEGQKAKLIGSVFLNSLKKRLNTQIKILEVYSSYTCLNIDPNALKFDKFKSTTECFISQFLGSLNYGLSPY